MKLSSPSSLRNSLVAPTLAALFLCFCNGNQAQNSTSSGSSSVAVDAPDPTPMSAELDVVEPAPAEPMDSGVAPVMATSVDAAMPAHNTNTVVDAGHTHSTHGTTHTTTTTTTTTTPAANPAVAEGQAVFDRTCGRCHPGGNARVGPRLAGRNDSEAHLRQVVRNGDGTMRAIPVARLSDGDLAKVVTYLRSIHAVR